MEHLVKILETEHGQGLYYDIRENDFCVDGLFDDYITVDVRSLLKDLDGTHVQLCEAFLPWLKRFVAEMKNPPIKPLPSQTVFPKSAAGLSKTRASAE